MLETEASETLCQRFSQGCRSEFQKPRFFGFEKPSFLGFEKPKKNPQKSEF